MCRVGNRHPKKAGRNFSWTQIEGDAYGPSTILGSPVDSIYSKKPNNYNLLPVLRDFMVNELVTPKLVSQTIKAG